MNEQMKEKNELTLRSLSRRTPCLCYSQQHLNQNPHLPPPTVRNPGMQQFHTCLLEGETGLTNEKPSAPTRHRVPGTVVGPAMRLEAGGRGCSVLRKAGRVRKRPQED